MHENKVVEVIRQGDHSTEFTFTMENSAITHVTIPSSAISTPK